MSLPNALWRGTSLSTTLMVALRATGFSSYPRYMTHCPVNRRTDASRIGRNRVFRPTAAFLPNRHTFAGIDYGDLGFTAALYRDTPMQRTRRIAAHQDDW